MWRGTRWRHNGRRLSRCAFVTKDTRIHGLTRAVRVGQSLCWGRIVSIPSSLEEMLQRVRRALFKRGLATDVVDDLVQESYHRLIEYKTRGVVERPEGFLVRTAVNLSIDRARQQARMGIASEPVEDYPIVDEGPGPDEVYAGRRRLEHLNAGLMQLDEVTQAMLKAQRLDGDRLSTIAERHGMSVSAVEKRIAKGIVFLVEWMEGW